MNKEEKNSNKCPICGRPTHKESKYCIFHASAEEKSEREFKRKLKEHVKKIKEEDGDFDFNQFIFVGDIDFKKDLNITVFKNANLSRAIFKGNTDLSEATFKGDANLSGVTFKGNAYLGEAIFEGYAELSRAIFKGNAYLSEATFKGDADLHSATFKGYASLSGATFKGNVYLRGITFKGDASLRWATFEGDADLRWATFEGDADLNGAIFKGKADFSYAKFLSTYHFEKAVFEGNVFFNNSIFSTRNDLNLKVIGRGFVSFKHACIENIFLELELDKEVRIDFSDSLLRNTKIKKGQIENHILQEKRKKFSEAQDIYLLLKNNFHSIGRYNDESWAFQKEKEMGRKSNCHFKTLHKWLGSCFLNAIYGYGERPWNVVISAGILIFVFAFVFSLIGIGNPEIIELKGVAVHQETGNIVDLTSKGLLKNSVIRNFPDSLYFSLITFTTLGYGDFRPLEGWGRILAGSEAFIGAFMMALFVYTFARRTGGR